MSLILYELAAADSQIRFSPHCWKIRMALAHQHLSADCRPWRFGDRQRLDFAGHAQVPVLIDGDRSICDSWQIALHLERGADEATSLFGGDTAIALTGFVNTWADSALLPALRPLIVLDIHACLNRDDQAYFRASRERRFGQRLEDLATARDDHLRTLSQTLAPLRARLHDSDYLGGASPRYADYCVFGMLMWARCVGAAELLEPTDPIWIWRERLLDAHGGIARNAATAPPRAGR